jgi:hypothetical protein
MRLLNNLHLNILANFIESIKNTELNENYIKNIALDMITFYKGPEKKVDEFIIKKRQDVELHEIITRISIILTKYCDVSKLLMDTMFFNDIIQTLILIADDEPTDYVQKLISKNKKISQEKIVTFIFSIVENSLIIMIQVIKGPEIISEGLTDKVILIL